MIRQGRVLVNGQKATRLGIRADPHTDRIFVDGREISALPEPKVSYLLNKPRGCLSTLADPQGRPTVRDLLRGVSERVFPVGRLDGDTEGLMILTNDGDLAHRVAHPSLGCPKLYQARVRGVLTERDRLRLERGVVRDSGRRFRPMQIRLIRASNRSWYELVLREGRKNQIRILFRLLGHPVEKLRRVAIGPLRDRNLPVGSFRPLRPAEIRSLLVATGAKRHRPQGDFRGARNSSRTWPKTRKT